MNTHILTHFTNLYILTFVPACTIELEWTGSGEPLAHQVNITGAEKPAYFYNIRYHPQDDGACACVYMRHHVTVPTSCTRYINPHNSSSKPHSAVQKGLILPFNSTTFYHQNFYLLLFQVAILHQATKDVDEEK